MHKNNDRAVPQNRSAPPNKKPRTGHQAPSSNRNRFGVATKTVIKVNRKAFEALKDK